MRQIVGGDFSDRNLWLCLEKGPIALSAFCPCYANTRNCTLFWTVLMTWQKKH
ncbi:hypothetical protein ES332_A07G122600v1 [Gossypium tomentosum]|uniref:Uncharacterized protein n=1 Tax=Gossypium tomentosum TaxID=34277 RepID=A0A5D2PRS7_GOSTO|nr:hypothetical protein ES332_A07G122600v1 [Gossypium tomentosum]